MNHATALSCFCRKIATALIRKHFHFFLRCFHPLIHLFVNSIWRVVFLLYFFIYQATLSSRWNWWLIDQIRRKKLSLTEAFLLSFVPPIVPVSSPLCPLLSSRQDVEHMLSRRLWSRWPWTGTKGITGVTSSSPCGLPQPAPSSAQRAELLSLPHLLPEH